MATITIIDTGYPNVTSTGTVAAASDMANDGSPITFKCKSMRYTRGLNIDDTAVPSKYADMEINKGSTQNPIIQIEGVLDRKTTADMDLIPEFDELIITKGIKCLYYNDSTDGYRDLTDSLGTGNANDGYTNHPTEAHLHVICKGLTITHPAGATHLTYKLTCEVTA